MKFSLRFYRCLAVALLGILTAVTAQSATLTGTVVGVSDGDTITVLDAEKNQYRIRLIGIDAPEKKQAYGSKSKENLSKLTYLKKVEVEWYKRDRYQRIIGKVTVTDCVGCHKQDIGLSQIKAGMAWWYRAYAMEQQAEDRSKYAESESIAQASKHGLWAEASPTPPWSWRKNSRE